MKKIISILFISISIFFSVSSYANDHQEYAVKSAFIYHFCRFSEWPRMVNDTQSDFKVAVFGGTKFSTVLERTLAGKKAHQRQMTVTRVQTPMDLTGFQVLVIPKKMTAQGLNLLNMKQNKLLDILTISDDAQAIELGVMVQLFIEKNKVRFRINVAESEQHGVKISPRLLKLADEVIGKETP